MAYLLKHISTDPVDLLPKHFQSVQTLLEIRDKVSQNHNFGIVLESDHPEQTKAALHALVPLIEKSPFTDKVQVTKPGYEFLDKNKFLYMETEDLRDIRDRIDRKIQREKLHGFYISFEDEEEIEFEDLEGKYQGKFEGGNSEAYYVSPNGKVFALYVEAKTPNMNIAQEKQFQDAIKNAVAGFDYKSFDPSMKIYYSGSSRVMEYRALLHDLKIAGIVSGLVIFLPLLLRFRRPQFVLLIFLPLLVGVPSGIVLASIWIPQLNITTSFLFAILGGLGVETGIHIFSRYYENRSRGLEPGPCWVDIYTHLGPAVLTAVAALATTFLLMGFSDFKGFSEFGLISGIGLWVLFILYFTFFPAVLLTAEKIRLLKFKQGRPSEQGVLRLSPQLIKICLIVFCVFTVFSVIATPRITFEYSSQKTRADDPRERVSRFKQKLTVGARINKPALLLVHGEEEARLLEAAIEQKRDGNPHTTLDYGRSLYSLVPADQDGKMAILAQIQKMLSDDSIRLVKDEKKQDLDKFKVEIRRPQPFVLSDVPEEIKKHFLTDQGTETLFLIFPKPRLEMDNGRNAMAFGSEVKDIATPAGVYHASSSAVVFADVLHAMFRDSKKIIVIAVLSVTFFVFLDFRNWKKTGLVMFSILAGVLWVMGVMYLLRLKFNLYNMAMIPAIMGISVDNSIHVYHRYEELGRGSLAKVLSTTGVAALLASLTNAAGFVGLSFATHGGLQSMGWVAVIGVVTCLISTLVFMPMLLQFREWVRGGNKGKALGFAED
jgi:hypothetical protein